MNQMGKVKCSDVCLRSPVNRKTEETPGSLVISLEQEDEPDGLCPALSVKRMGLCRAWTC